MKFSNFELCIRRQTIVLNTRKINICLFIYFIKREIKVFKSISLHDLTLNPNKFY